MKNNNASVVELNTGDSHKVVVVGAGPGGLATAMMLAASGVDVTVLERQERIGGRTTTFDIDGYKFDAGPTFFLYPRILEEVFAFCGRNLHDEVELVRLDPQYRLVFGDGESLICTGDVPRMQEEIRKFAPQDAEALPGYMADNEGKLAAFEPILQRPFNKLTDYFKTSDIKALMKLRPHRSVNSDLSRYFSDERVRLAFTFQSKYLGMSPFNCPSLFTILAYMEYAHGVYHPVGGCGAVMDAMARVAREMGVDIRLNEPVESFEFDGDRIVAAKTARAMHRADAFVVNADFANAMGSLIPNEKRKRWTDRKIDKKKFSCSTFMLYLGVEGHYDDLAHHTIFLADDYETNLEEIVAGARPPADPSIYVQNASVTDATLAPPGGSALYVLVPVGNLKGGIDWQAEAPAYREKVLKLLEAKGYTNLRERIRVEKMITPADWQSDMGVHLGATFNLAHSLDQMLYFRPHNRFEDVEGLYLTGGGTHPGSGLPVIFESARISTQLIAEDLGFDIGPLRGLDIEPMSRPTPIARAS